MRSSCIYPWLMVRRTTGVLFLLLIVCNARTWATSVDDVDDADFYEAVAGLSPEEDFVLTPLAEVDGLVLPEPEACNCCRGCGPQWELLPQGIAYRSYLASERESRFRSFWNYDGNDDRFYWDATLGGRVPLIRYGGMGVARPIGWQLELEGASIVRLDVEEKQDVQGADFRFGVPLIYATERYQMKIAYFHISSHAGDEFLLKNPDFVRLNYTRDAIVWGHSYYLTDAFRVYGEVGCAFHNKISGTWAVQFGIDWAPAFSTGFRGAPFAAVNAHLHEENDYGGNFVVQLGWAWRSSPVSGMFRLGFEHYNGKSDQYQFYTGFALWYDY